MRPLTGRTTSAVQVAMKAERCVHHWSPLATCAKCVEVCPREALELGNVALLFDEAACDGCALCAAVCPEGVLDFSLRLPVIADEEGMRAAFVACERGEITGHADVMTCVHAIGLRTLFDLYGRGVRRIVCTSGDCARCERSTGKPLGQVVGEANRVLASRHGEEIVFEEETAVSWRQRLSAAHRIGPSDSGRRQFLRGALEKLMDAGSPPDREAAGTPYPGLPPAPHDVDALFFHVPEISETACRACDACVRLCQHKAILLWRSADGLGYTLDAGRCTGCNLCMDVCDAHAVTVNALVSPKQLTVPLATLQCAACGVRFLVPRQADQDRAFCNICGDGKKHSRLFQINA